MKRQEWLTFGLIFLLFIGLSLIKAGCEPEQDPYGLDSVRPEGLKGFYLLLEQVGFDVDRADWLEGNSGAGIVLFPDPYEIAILADSLFVWVEAGNDLVILGDPRIENWSNEELIIEYSDFEETAANDTNNVSCFDYYAGNGLIRVIPDGTICHNETLRQDDNAVLMINLLRDLAGKKLYFLNLNTMLQVSRQAKTIWAVVPPAVWLIMVQLGLGLYLWINAKTKYLGQPLPQDFFNIPDEDENIRALGRLLHEHKQNKAVLECLYQLFREDVAMFLGIGPLENDMEFIAQTESQYPTDGPMLLRLQRFRQQKSVSDRDLLQAEDIMQQIRERWINTDDGTALDPKTNYRSPKSLGGARGFF